MMVEPWQNQSAARDVVRQVIALHEHLAPYLDGNDTPLVKALLARRAWALWCLRIGCGCWVRIIRIR